MAAVQAGDRAALAALVARHHSSLLGYLYNMVGGDRPLAEDLVQETFVRLLRGGHYTVDRAFKPWLYAIATNLARDHFKAAATRYAAPGAVAPDRPDPEPEPEAQALAAEQGQQVAAALARLGPEYRAALVLRFYGDLSLQEVATTLGTPVGTVKSRLSVGCRRLRAILTGAQEASER